MNLSLISEENVYINDSNIFSHTKTINLPDTTTTVKPQPSSQEHINPVNPHIRSLHLQAIHSSHNYNSSPNLIAHASNPGPSTSTHSYKQDINMLRIYQAPAEMLSTFIKANKQRSDNPLNRDEHHYENTWCNRSFDELNASQNYYNQPNSRNK